MTQHTHIAIMQSVTEPKHTLVRSSLRHPRARTEDAAFVAVLRLWIPSEWR